MTAKAARKQRAASRNQKRAEQHAEAREEVGVIAVKKQQDAKQTERNGLDWLLHKKRISRRQYLAGRAYGDDCRAAAMHGVVAMRSCLNFQEVRGASMRDLPQVIYHQEAQARVDAAQAALSWQTDMIGALYAICVREVTPWTAVGSLGKARDVARLETVLGIALDLLDKHYRSAR